MAEQKAAVKQAELRWLCDRPPGFGQAKFMGLVGVPGGLAPRRRGRTGTGKPRTGHLGRGEPCSPHP